MRKIASIVLVIVCLFSICFSFGCEKASSYTEEEHIARITERVLSKGTTWGFPEDKPYHSFEVYPLFNENEELQFFLVEYEPYGFSFIMLTDEDFFACFSGITMYLMSSEFTAENVWSPYIRDLSFSQPYPNQDKQWILDEYGQKINYNKSPFYVYDKNKVEKYLKI